MLELCIEEEMWELWIWNGHYIKGKLLKRYKAKDSLMKYAKKNVEFHKMVQSSSNKREFFLDDKEGRPVGIIINNT